MLEDITSILAVHRLKIRSLHVRHERQEPAAIVVEIHSMRTIEFMNSAVQKEKAKETMEVFAPLAAKYGNIKCRLEFDEISAKYLQEEAE